MVTSYEPSHQLYDRFRGAEIEPLMFEITILGIITLIKAVKEYLK